ncbi:MAG: hypothetical protein R3354_01580, partial [Thiohalomonadales bacterium]|nr:hypothetical protein [Thiohalomonadales bacterium]
MNWYVKWWGGLLIFLVVPTVFAQPWEFRKPIVVTTSVGEGIFHHLDSSGRRNIAVSDDTVAIAWEDNRDNSPRIYLARKPVAADSFNADIKVSGSGEAYEPTLVALTGNRFALAWEEEGRIHVRLVTPDRAGPVIIVGDEEATQASLARQGNDLLLVYSEREDRFGRIWFQRIVVDGQTLRAMPRCPVDAMAPKDDQLYPAVVGFDERVIVAWEDRRPGHTIIMAAQNSDQAACRFTAPQRISQRSPGPRMPYGKGHGVARVALATYGTGHVLAVWADKRNFREGYDIYAAEYLPVGTSLFGPNMKVQDTFGGYAQQWHATAAGDSSSRLVVGWDDNRDGNADIMLSWREDGDWSDDLSVP